MGANEFWLVLLILMTIGYFVFRIQEYQKEKTIVTQERANLISKPIPSFVQKSIFDYESGAYGGEDQSLSLMWVQGRQDCKYGRT